MIVTRAIVGRSVDRVEAIEDEGKVSQ